MIYGKMFLVLAATLVSTLLFSQENRIDFSRFELSASTGMVMTGYPKYGAEASSLPLVYDLTVRYFPGPNLSVGLSAGNNRDVYWGDDLQMWLTPSVQYHWLRRPSFTAYSGVGYVLSLKDLPSRNNDWYVGFQYTPIGITFGRSLFGLAELGFGPRYFPLRLGLGYRF